MTSKVSLSLAISEKLTFDASWGNVRRYPLLEERNRSGGAGVYYHVRCISTFSLESSRIVV